MRFNLFVFIIISFNSYAQPDIIDIKETQNIDPRQYIKIYEISSRTKEKKLIGEWKNNSFEITADLIDINGEVEIFFNKKELAKNIDFAGELSLAATSGSQKIEIAPYSEVGENRQVVGISKISSRQAAMYYTSILNVLENTNFSLAALSSIDEWKSENKSNLWDLFDFLKKPDSLQESYYKDLYESTLEMTNNKSTYPSFEKLKGIIKESNEDSTKAYIIRLVDFINSQKSLPNNTTLVAANELNRNLKRVVKYFNFFNSDVGRDYLLNFSRIFSFDNIFLEEFYKNLENVSDSLSNIIKKPNYEISSEFQDFIKNDLRSLQSDIFIITNAYDQYSSILPNSNEYSSKNLIKNEALNAVVINSLATSVGSVIYMPLVNGLIKLEKSGLKEGDNLEIYLLCKGCLEDKKEIDNNTLFLPIGNYSLKEVGWRLKISDSFLLVKRDVNDKNDTTLSPSMFKGGAGVSLLYSFSNDRNYKIGFPVRFFKSIEPSFGINVSYLDFSTEKDFEIGTGLIVGLFRNRIFYTCGWNLNIDRHSFYQAIGFSFIDLANKVNQTINSK